jgi:hypothetical protein
MVGAAMKVNKFGQPKENRKTSDTNSWKSNQPPIHKIVIVMCAFILLAQSD